MQQGIAMYTYESGGELCGDRKQLGLVAIHHRLHAAVQDIEIGLFRQLEQRYA